MPGLGHIGGTDAQPREYERRIVALLRPQPPGHHDDHTRKDPDPNDTKESQ